MAYLTIQSTNPDLSHILGKNPATIKESGKAWRRELRKGVIYGWYRGTDTFNLLFVDHASESSFPTSKVGSEFEYLDRGRYSSPYIPLSMINIAFRDAIQNTAEKDVESGPEDNAFWTTVTFMIKVPASRMYDHMVKDLSSESLEISNKIVSPHGNYLEIAVKARTVHSALNAASAICLVQSAIDRETDIFVTDELLKRYANILNQAKVGYHSRYLLQMKLAISPKMFHSVKEILSDNGKYTLNHGNTKNHRLSAIRKVLTGGTSLIDIGCGELTQSLLLSKVYELVTAVDVDEAVVASAARTVERKKVDNINCIHGLVDEDWVDEQSLMFNDAHVLLTEVLEHMELEAADKLMNKILSVSPEKVVVTCPNRDFNNHYFIEEGEFRHPDHCFEPSFSEFCDWMATLAAEHEYKVTIEPLGDIVEDCSASCIATFYK